MDRTIFEDENFSFVVDKCALVVASTDEYNLSMLSRAIALACSFSALLHAEDTALGRREFAQAVLASMRGDDEQQAKHEEAARIAHPTAVLLGSRRAQRLLEQGDVKGASTIYRDLAAARADSLRTQLLYADFLRSTGKEDDFALGLAMKTLENALPQFPGDAQILERLFRLYEQKSQREKSLAIYRNYLSQVGADPIVAENFSRVLFDADDAKSNAEIDRLFVDRMNKAPENSVLARAASEHFRTAKQLDQAIAMLQLHVDVAPTSLDLRVRLGILQLSHAQQAEGEKTLLEVLRIAPSLFLAHQTLAKLYDKQNKPEDARLHRAEVLKIRGGDAEEFRQLGREWTDAGQHKNARILLEKACFYYPKDVELAYLLASATRRDPETASRAPALFRIAEALGGSQPIKNPMYSREAAEAFWQAKNYVQAESQLRQAIKLYPPEEKKESAAAMRLLASWWQQQGKNAEPAKALLQRAEMLEK